MKPDCQLHSQKLGQEVLPQKGAWGPQLPARPEEFQVLTLTRVQTSQPVSESLRTRPVISVEWEIRIAACVKNCVAPSQLYLQSGLKLTSHADPTIVTCHKLYYS